MADWSCPSHPVSYVHHHRSHVGPDAMDLPHFSRSTFDYSGSTYILEEINTSLLDLKEIGCVAPRDTASGVLMMIHQTTAVCQHNVIRLVRLQVGLRGIPSGTIGMCGMARGLLLLRGGLHVQVPSQILVMLMIRLSTVCVLCKVGLCRSTTATATGIDSSGVGAGEETTRCCTFTALS